MDAIAHTAEVAVEEILNDSGMALMAILRSNKMLPLLVRHLNFSQDALRLTTSSVHLGDITWPLICDFTIDRTTECIREFAATKWDVDRKSVHIWFTTFVQLLDVVSYHFKVILMKPPPDHIRLHLPMAGTGPIYFLVEYPKGPEWETHYVDVTYQFAGSKTTYRLSSSAKEQKTMSSE